MITLFLKCPKSNELKYSLKALLCGKSTLSEVFLISMDFKVKKNV